MMCDSIRWANRQAYDKNLKEVREWASILGYEKGKYKDTGIALS